MSANENNGKNRNEKTMVFIAVAVTALAVIGTLAIACVSLARGYKGDNEFFQAQTGFIAQTLLPIWGTWLGTILAFYFAKGNLDTMTEANKELVDKLSERDQQLASKHVSDVMKPFNKIKPLYIDEDGDKALSEIIKKDEFKDFNRFPIFSSKDDKTLVYVVHRSIIHKYFYEHSGNDKDTKKINDFLKEAEIQEVLEDSAAFVAETATLLDAKNEMSKRKYCEDVFVTKDGKSSGEVIGWISDKDIFGYGKV